MKALIVSDVHSNFEALTKVIESAGASPGFDEIWSLGDLVGYGPDPAGVIDLIREHDHRAVAGNHDLASVGRLSLEAFNQYAAAANVWTGQVLDQDRREFLGDQPLKLEIDEFTIVHGESKGPDMGVRGLRACRGRMLQSLRYLLVPRWAFAHPVHMPHGRRPVRRALLRSDVWYSLPPGRPAPDSQSWRAGAAARRRSQGSLCRIRLRRRHNYSLPHRVRRRRNTGEDALTRLARVLNQPPGSGTMTGRSEKIA